MHKLYFCISKNIPTSTDRNLADFDAACINVIKTVAIHAGFM